MRRAFYLLGLALPLVGCGDDRKIELLHTAPDQGGESKQASCDQAPDCTPCGEGLSHCVYGACIANACGDSCLVGDEVCDDGNERDGDGCDSRCKVETPAGCGNGQVDGGEECDDGAEGSATCTPRCTLVRCGDRIKSPTEECDDGNQANGDSCRSDCTLAPALCGNGLLDLGEQCDDGNAVDTDECRTDCTYPLDSGTDDGSMDSGTGASDAGGGHDAGTHDGGTHADAGHDAGHHADAGGSGSDAGHQHDAGGGGSDAGVVYGDKPEQKAACKQCREDNCRDFDTYNAVGECFDKTDATLVQLCVDLRNCMFEHKSGYDGTNGPIESFCGTKDPSTACQTPGNADGPCRAQWALATGVCATSAACNQAAISTGTAEILKRASAPSRPSGAAYSLTSCDAANCNPQCMP
ncbi:MAG: DUF4215 domain-containing protein [Myxococcales bacterium]